MFRLVSLLGLLFVGVSASKFATLAETSATLQAEPAKEVTIKIPAEPQGSGKPCSKPEDCPSGEDCAIGLFEPTSAPGQCQKHGHTKKKSSSDKEKK